MKAGTYRCYKCLDEFTHDCIIEVKDYLTQLGNRRRFICHACLKKENGKDLEANKALIVELENRNKKCPPKRRKK